MLHTGYENVDSPHAIGAEKSVLSSLLQDISRLDHAPALTGEHFHFPSHRTLFGVLRGRHLAGQPVELVALIQHLHDQRLLDEIGGPSAVYDLFTYAPHAGHFTHHLALLTDKLARRQGIRLAGKLVELAHEAESAHELIAATGESVTTLHDLIAGTRPPTDVAAHLSTWLDEFQARCEGRTPAMGIATSLPELNERFRGLHPRHTLVISGYPGGGKSLLCGQLAADAALAGHPALICSLEMSAPEILQRLIAYTAGLPGQATADPLGHARACHATTLTKDTLRRISHGLQSIRAAPLHIEDLVGQDVHQVCACIRRRHRVQPLSVVVVDFIQRLRAAPETRRDTREQQLSHAANTLADLAKELGFTLLLASQRNKDGGTKHAEAIDEAADLHLKIQQDRNGQTASLKHLGLFIAKDRHHGQAGQTLPILLDGPMVRFVEREVEEVVMKKTRW